MMQAVTLIANVCNQQQLYPDNEKTKRKQVEKHLEQWRKEFTHEYKKELEDESESGLLYYAEMLQLLDDLQFSLLRFPTN